MMRRNSKVYLSILLSVYGLGATKSWGQQQYEWAGTFSGNYHTASNWTPAGVPGGPGSVGMIGASASPYTVTLNQSAAPDRLILNSSDATVTQTAGTFGAGVLELRAGAYRVTGGSFTTPVIVARGGIFRGNLTGTLIEGPMIGTEGARTRFESGTWTNVTVKGDMDVSVVTGRGLNFQDANVDVSSRMDLFGNQNYTGNATINFAGYGSTLRAVNLPTSVATTATLGEGIDINFLGNFSGIQPIQNQALQINGKVTVDPGAAGVVRFENSLLGFAKPIDLKSGLLGFLGFNNSSIKLSNALKINNTGGYLVLGQVDNTNSTVDYANIIDNEVYLVGGVNGGVVRSDETVMIRNGNNIGGSFPVVATLSYDKVVFEGHHKYDGINMSVYSNSSLNNATVEVNGIKSIYNPFSGSGKLVLKGGNQTSWSGTFAAGITTEIVGVIDPDTSEIVEVQGKTLIKNGGLVPYTTAVTNRGEFEVESGGNFSGSMVNHGMLTFRGGSKSHSVVDSQGQPIIRDYNNERTGRLMIEDGADFAGNVYNEGGYVYLAGPTTRIFRIDQKNSIASVSHGTLEVAPGAHVVINGPGKSDYDINNSSSINFRQLGNLICGAGSTIEISGKVSGESSNHPLIIDVDHLKVFYMNINFPTPFQIPWKANTITSKYLLVGTSGSSLYRYYFITPGATHHVEYLYSGFSSFDYVFGDIEAKEINILIEATLHNLRTNAQVRAEKDSKILLQKLTARDGGAFHVELGGVGESVYFESIEKTAGNVSLFDMPLNVRGGTLDIEMAGRGEFSRGVLVEGEESLVLFDEAAVGSVYDVSELTIRNGAEVRFGDDWLAGELVELSGGAKLRVDGELAIFGNGKLLIGLDGEAEEWVVSETAEISGLLEIRLDGGYRPDVGDEFQLIRAGNFVGGFDEVMLPELPGNRSWDTTGLGAGRLAVIPEPGAMGLVCGAMLFGGMRRQRA